MKSTSPKAQHAANRKAALAKLAKLAINLPATYSDAALCTVIAAEMHWSPPSLANCRDFIARFAAHKLGKRAKPRTITKPEPLKLSANPAMMRAIERSERQPKLININSKPTKESK